MKLNNGTAMPALALGAFAALQRGHGKLTVVYVMGVAGIVGVVLQHTVV